MLETIGALFSASNQDGFRTRPLPQYNQTIESNLSTIGFLLDATSVFLVCSELLELMQAGVAFLNASLIPDVFPILLDASSKTIIAKSIDL
ncbi:hypothetical protein ACS0TY_014265 [Phlomoides rotata]